MLVRHDRGLSGTVFFRLSLCSDLDLLFHSVLDFVDLAIYGILIGLLFHTVLDFLESSVHRTLIDYRFVLNEDTFSLITLGTTLNLFVRNCTHRRTGVNRLSMLLDVDGLVGQSLHVVCGEGVIRRDNAAPSGILCSILSFLTLRYAVT